MKIGSFFLGNRRTVKPFFVGSYGNDLTRGVYAFHLDINNGEILKKGHFKSPSNPTAMYKRDRFTFVCYKNNSGRATDGGMSQYAAMDSQFGLAAQVYNQGKTFMDCFINQDRSYAYAVDYYNNEIVVIPFVKQKIIKVTQTLKHYGSGPVEKRQEQPHPHYIDETPDSKRIFVCDLGIDQVVMYSIGEKGMLFRDSENTIDLTPGSGPKKMIFSPNGQYAYVLNELSNTVCVYQYEDCHFTFIQEIDTFPKDEYTGKSLAGDILITPTGDYLMVTNRGHDSVSAFEVQDNGKLVFVEYMDTDENPRSMLLIDDHWLIIAAQKGGTLETFELKRNESKGVLYETHYNYMIGEPICMIEGKEY